MGTSTPNYAFYKPDGSDPVDNATDLNANWDRADAHAHSGTYVPADPTLVITYNADSSVASVAETQGGTTITTTFTYNPDGTIATSTRLGVTRTYSYTAGNLVGVA